MKNIEPVIQVDPMIESGKKRILLVEDDRDIREAIGDVLQIEGYAVDAVADGQEALDFLRSKPAPDVILLDLMMPIKDGFQFRIEQTADPKIADIPVVIMSADHKVEQKSAQLNVSRFLRKPIEIDALLEIMQSVTS